PGLHRNARGWDSEIKCRWWRIRRRFRDSWNAISKPPRWSERDKERTVKPNRARSDLNPGVGGYRLRRGQPELHELFESMAHRAAPRRLRREAARSLRRGWE